MVSISTGKDSKQDHCTPKDFLAAVEDTIGNIVWDLAASADNAVVPNGAYYGLDNGMDSLKQDWSALATYISAQLPGNQHLLWLNPPFNNVAPFAAKCVEYGNDLPLENVFVAFLVPDSNTNWYRDYVRDNAWVIRLENRLNFNGQPFPKDCILAIFGHGCAGRISYWDWKRGTWTHYTTNRI